MKQPPFILILYFSQHGATLELARYVAQGIESIHGMSAKIRTVPSYPAPESDWVQPIEGPAYVKKEDLLECSGIILGSPTRFGNMAAPLKYFIDSTSDIWLSGGLIDKPAGAFTSSSTLHGGQETTLLTMLLPLIHHGAFIVGVPFSEAALYETETGGTPYGPSHVAGANNDNGISVHEKQTCICLGKRVSYLASVLTDHQK